MTGCALFLSEESRYLRTAKDRATDTEVRQRLGPPKRINSQDNGTTQWTYERRTYVQEGTNNAWTTVGAWRCDTYRLTFDAQHILRKWTHRSRIC
ncbi:MAG TPA: hypothetical protein VFS39_17430 [Nitrospira sp.]|nr:hypothetical protein [Nitrospira sp.]